MNSTLQTGILSGDYTGDTFTTASNAQEIAQSSNNSLLISDSKLRKVVGAKEKEERLAKEKKSKITPQFDSGIGSPEPQTPGLSNISPPATSISMTAGGASFSHSHCLFLIY